MIELKSNSIFYRFLMVLMIVAVAIICYSKDFGIMLTLKSVAIMFIFSYVVMYNHFYTILMTRDNIIVSNTLLPFYKTIIPLRDIEKIVHAYSDRDLHRIRFSLKRGGRKSFYVCGGDKIVKGIERMIEVFNERKEGKDVELELMVRDINSIIKKQGGTSLGICPKILITSRISLVWIVMFIMLICLFSLSIMCIKFLGWYIVLLPLAAVFGAIYYLLSTSYQMRLADYKLIVSNRFSSRTKTIPFDEIKMISHVSGSMSIRILTNTGRVVAYGFMGNISDKKLGIQKIIDVFEDYKSFEALERDKRNSSSRSV